MDKKRVMIKNNNITILKVLGNGKADKGIDKLLRNYQKNCDNPKIKKFIDSLTSK